MSIHNKLYFCTYVNIVHVYVLSTHQNRLGETALACIWNIFSNETCCYKKKCGFPWVVTSTGPEGL